MVKVENGKKVANMAPRHKYFLCTRLLCQTYRPAGDKQGKNTKKFINLQNSFSCQSSSIPTLVSDWLTHSWFITQSDRPLPDFPHETSQLLRTNKQPFQDFHNRSSWLPRSLGSWWSRWTGQDRTVGVGDVCFFLTMRCFNDAMFSNS